MLQSMTGYGQGRIDAPGYKIVVEIKSLNSRNLEIHFRLPGAYFQQEVAFRNQLNPVIQRGKVSFWLTVERINTSRVLQSTLINFELLDAYHKQIKAYASALGISDNISLDTLLNLPNVIQEVSQEIDEEELKLVFQAVEEALQKLVQDRKREGQLHLNEFVVMSDQLEQLLLKIEPYEPIRLESLKTRLKTSLSELADTVGFNEDRYHQELIYYIEKYDFTEEKVRIRAHLSNFRTTLHEPESQGRKLTFITQELWREINTLGVKAYHPDIQILVVDMKDIVEKLKEQLMNIL